MKVTAVRTHCLTSELETPFAFSQGWVKRRGACVVEVETDAGLTGWGSSVGQAASLHLICALPLANPSLHADEPVFEYDCSAHPFRERLVDRPLRQRDGWLELPDAPGLGIEVDRGALERYRA